MDALAVAEGAVVAELGAGGGWFTLRLASRVGPNGLVYAEDIQPGMIEGIARRMKAENLTNVKPILGTTTDPRLPPGLDAALISDAFHEMDDPKAPSVIVTLLRNIGRSLKPQGRLGIVDWTRGRGRAGAAREQARRSGFDRQGGAGRGAGVDLARGDSAVRLPAGVRARA